MPKVSDLIESKFLKRGDVNNNGRGALLTVANIAQYNVAMAGAGEEMKWCLEFTETEKPLVLNTTNIRLLENILQSDDTDEWVGKKIVLYDDPNIMYAGRVVGGIRVRAVKTQAGKPPAAQQQTIPAPDEEIPFD